MSGDDVTVADVEAMADVIDTITEYSDQTPFEVAAELRLALEVVKRKAHDAIKLLETQMMTVLEDGGPRRFGDATYEVANDGVWRADHDTILDAAVRYAMRRAVNTDTGEVSPSAALDELVAAVKALYLSPSTSAKVGGIEKVGLDKREARRYEQRGKKLVVIDHNQGGYGDAN